MAVNPEIPHNDLVYLPPQSDIILSPEIMKLEARARTALGELKGIAHIIPNKDILINNVSLLEAKDSSEIENIITTHDQLYLSLSQAQTKDVATKEVINYREALFRGMDLIQKHNMIKTSDIVKIQQTILKNDAGIRNTMGTKLINDKTGKAVYTPPENKQNILELMDNLSEFINTEEASLSNLAIMHYQFESIHPFYDGNGRTGRILNSLYLVLKGFLDSPLLYLSKYIIQNKNAYYQLLHDVTFKQNWKDWIIYILKGIESTSRETIIKIEKIKILMDHYYETIKHLLPKIYSKDLVEALFENPYVKTQIIVKRLNIERKAASRYLKQIENISLIRSQKSGKEILYINDDLINILKS